MFEQGGRRDRAFRWREVTGSGGEEPGSIPGTALTHGATQLSQGWPKVARPRTPAATETAAPAAANCSGGIDDTRAIGGAARAEGCGVALCWDRGRAQQLQRQGAPSAMASTAVLNASKLQKASEGV